MKEPEYKLINHVLTLFAESSKQIDAISKSGYTSGADHPVIKADRLRYEVYKYYYLTQRDFELYKKSDASEFMQCLLELLHYCHNLQVKKDIDSDCKHCLVHQIVHLNEYSA